MSRRRRGALHRRRRQHLWRQGRHQSVRRPAVQGPSARRHRPRAMLRADAPAARHRPTPRRSRARAWHCSTISASAAPASSRSTNAPEAGHDRPFRHRAQPCAGYRACRTRAAAVLPRDARRDQSGLHGCRRREGRRLCRNAGAADLSVLPGNDGRRTGLRIPRPCSASTSSSVLHGEQRFTYRAPVMVGDTLRFEPRIASITDKKGGAHDAGRRRNQGHQPARRPRRGLLPHGRGAESKVAA